MIRVAYMVLVLLCTAWTVHGQEYPMLHFTVEDGLPSNTIYQVFRDSKGYLWIGTDKGIARYNGAKFEKFTTFNGIADNEVFFFTEDRYGRIWLGTYNGQLCYYQNDSFHTAKNTPFLRLPVKSPYVQNIVNEQDSSVTFVFSDRTILVNIKNERATIIHVPFEDEQQRRLGHAHKRKDGDYEALYIKPYYLVGKHTYVIFDSAGHQKHVRYLDVSSRLKNVINQNHTYFIDSNCFFDADFKILQRSAHPVSYIQIAHTFYKDDKNFFIGLRNGLRINDSINILKEKWVVSVTADNYGNYWIGTHDNGLYCLGKDFQQTRKYDNEYTGVVKGATIAEDRIIFLTDRKNIYCLSKTVTSLLLNFAAKSTDETPDLSPSNNASLYDAGNYYCLADQDRITIKNVCSPKPATSIARSVLPWFVAPKSMFFADDYLYVFTRELAIRINRKDINNSKMNFEPTVYLAHKSRIFSSAQNGNNIWYSRLDSVYKIEKGKSIAQQQFRGESFKSFGFYGKYMVGYTHYNRLIICRNFEKNIHIDTVPQQNCIWNGIYRLDDEHALIGTDGLYRVITLNQEDSLHPYSVAVIEDPLIPLRAESVCADAHSCYFFAGGAVTAIDKEILLRKVAVPVLRFTTLKTENKKYNIVTDMELKFEEAKNVIISFSSLSEWGKEMTYQYSVSKNGNDQWISLAGETINLITLGYGDYKVSIRGRSASTDFNNAVTFTLHIAPPFWVTWWFILLCIAAAIGITFVIVRLRILYVVRMNKKMHEREIKFMKSEYKALNALMNPHFIFNTLNNVQSLFNENDKMAANAYLRVFADLIRQNMHNVSKEVISLQKEIDLVTNYLRLEQLRFEDKLTFYIDVDDDLDLSDIMVPPLLIQPIVENSIKHGILPLRGAQGKIWINIVEHDDQLMIEVKDNGVGMNTVQKDEGQLHESFGLANIKKRIEQLSIIQDKYMVFTIEDVKDETGKITGTVVKLVMALS